MRYPGPSLYVPPSGLLHPSLLRMAKIATVEADLVGEVSGVGDRRYCRPKLK